MTIALPRMLVLDTATLGAMSRDFRSSNPKARSKVAACIEALSVRNIYIALSWTQTAELFRHENDDVFYDRFKFLGGLPHIAWVRPYQRHWFPGSHVDVLLRELHVLEYGQHRSWQSITSNVRTEFWETGAGIEMFGPNLHFWEVMRREYQYEQCRETTVASISRIDYGVDSVRLSQVNRREFERYEDWPRKTVCLAKKMCDQIEVHGDPRFQDSAGFSKSFALETFHQVEAIRASGKGLAEGLIASTGVPRSAIRPEHTIGDLGDLAVYVRQLGLLCEHLVPPCVPDIISIPMDALPTYWLQHKLRGLQKSAVRVSGSDIGDSHAAGLAMYADVTEVDKRTLHHLSRIRKQFPQLQEVLRPIIKSENYDTLAKRVDTILVG